MAQKEVHQFLRENSNRLFTSKELEVMFGGSVSVNLKRLRRFAKIPIFMLYRGKSKTPYYTYIEKAKKYCQKRGLHYYLNNKTMMRIE